MVLGVPAGNGVGVLLLDQEPLLAVVLERRRPGTAGSSTRPNDREAAANLLAVEDELQLAVLHRRLRVGRLRLGLPGPPVPDDDVARPVLGPRDHALEVEVLHRMRP